MKSTAFKTVAIEDPKNIPPGERPEVSLCSVLPDLLVPRELKTVLPYTREAVFVLVNQDPEESVRKQVQLLLPDTDKVRVATLSPNDEPNLFLRDVPETYQKNKDLAGEEYRGPFTGQLLLADHSAARNRGLELCTSEWQLCLDADEVLLDPSQLPGACRQLDLHRRDSGYVARRYLGDVPRSSLEAKLVRNLPALHFEGSARETLEGSLRPTLLDGCLAAQTRPCSRPGEAFKVLYAEARCLDWDVPLANLLHMARAADRSSMPTFAESAVDYYLSSSLFPEGRAWAYAIQGEFVEPSSPSEASRWYEKSLAEYPGWKSCFRLARSRFKEQKYRECAEAYATGTERHQVVQLEDDGADTAASTLVYMTVALHELGQKAEAVRSAEALKKLFPDNNTVAEIHRRIAG
jgi:hypothetical protein